MNNFWARTVTGLSMVFLLLFSLWYNQWLFAGIFLTITILGIWEFYSLFASGEIIPQKIYGTICGAILYLMIFWFNISGKDTRLDLRLYFPVYSFLALFFLTFVIEIYRKRPRPLENIAVTLTGVIYVALPLALLNLMNDSNTAYFLGFPAYLLGYFIITWFYDTGAYLCGKSFGKHKFFERISPKKTWEGTVAGAMVALLTSLAISYMVPVVAKADWLMLAILVVVFGTFGDLTESLFKRSLNIKDSGNILPGHGGILDRFDTVFISAPFVFLYFILRNTI
jgi:phosphatidate cytidylyltransferase